ncbi:2-C-methyl-D-erythritol 2,4-cyclodiphosphate synthase [Planctomycetota bacterium]|nr:2-C-methyl-D-erythritol 2,4-cyclodiphosphate synthase [Planctomycetota bacterium]
MDADPRVGIGYDIHRLVEDTASPGIKLAGVLVPCQFRLIAHSDGDVALHALCDALLGALGAGDLGEHFPDTDAAHRGRDSADFVSAVLALPAMHGWRIANLDLNLIVQTPRLSGHKPAMRSRLAELFHLPVDRCGVKARTNEGLDAIGAHQAVAAQAVVLLVR